MSYNLTELQKNLARWIVTKIRSGELPETFTVRVGANGRIWVEKLGEPSGSVGPLNFHQVQSGTFEALAESKLLTRGTEGYIGGRSVGISFEARFTVTKYLEKAVDSNFAEEETHVLVSTFAQPHPPEIAMSLDRLRAKFPDPKKLGFLVMRFAASRPFARIVEVIKETAAKYGVEVIRADENEFHADLWGNVRTHLHGCGFGIAVYERIESEEPNANVGLEVGYLLAMNKPVLLLKDKTVKTLQADLAGRLYKDFDPHDPDATIPAQLEKWLEDNGVVVHARKQPLAIKSG